MTFNTNGGNLISDVSKPKGTIVDLKEYVPIREGYKFEGWYNASNLKRKITSVTLKKNTTVYAKWTETMQS